MENSEGRHFMRKYMGMSIEKLKKYENIAWFKKVFKWSEQFEPLGQF